MPNKTHIALALVIVGLLVGGFLFLHDGAEPAVEEVPIVVEEEVVETISAPVESRVIIGNSVEGREIEAYSIGTGEDDLLFVGGIHGGYEWNSILLAYEMIDYFKNNIDVIPENITVHIIPNLNPDGLFLATGLEGKFSAESITSNAMHASGEGRFNANDVDLNRNFDCKWAPESTWRGKVVSAGTEVFSEPEAIALRDYVATISPKAVVFWHSQANNVYASECENGVLPETLAIMNAYSSAGSYGAVPVFDAYPITGDAEGWLASIGIPAITVELETRTSIEWTRNLAGVNALLNQFGK